MVVMLCVFSVCEPTATGAWHVHITEEEDTFRKTQTARMPPCAWLHIRRSTFLVKMFLYRKKKECISNLASLL